MSQKICDNWMNEYEKKGSTENNPRKTFFFIRLPVFAECKQESLSFSNDIQLIGLVHSTADADVVKCSVCRMNGVSLGGMGNIQRRIEILSEKVKSERRKKNGMPKRIVAIANDTNKYDHQMLFIIINF